MVEPASPIVLRVNGEERRLATPRTRTLLSVLRTELGLTGTKYGCGAGECGACTVLIDWRPVRSCQTPVSHAEGRSVLTVEGLEREGRLHPVQQAFIDAQAFQCGYCTPGMIMEAVSLLRANPRPTELDIRRLMRGHLCRCGMYNRIVEAIRSAGEKMER